MKFFIFSISLSGSSPKTKKHRIQKTSIWHITIRRTMSRLRPRVEVLRLLPTTSLRGVVMTLRTDRAAMPAVTRKVARHIQSSVAYR